MFLLTASLTALAFASADAAPAAEGDAPADPAQEIIVTAPVRQSERDVLQGTSVLDGPTLDRERRATIGETLARLPGVSATSFGPGASRPVLRGFQGDRVRVLSDGIGSFDAASSSADHAVVLDPLLAERVEVLRGPVALLYGSSAVGGVVNVLDGRISRTVPEAGYRLGARAGYGSAADERNIAASADLAVGSRFVVNVNGSYLKAGDLRVGGAVLAPAARRAALAAAGKAAAHGHDHDHDHDHDHGHSEPDDYAAPAALRGRLPNSALETWSAGIGSALVTDGGTLGVAYSRYESRYGIPIRYATEVGQHVHASRINLAQDRVDLRGEVRAGGAFLDAIRLRAGHAAYHHDELEEDGSIGTSVRSKGTEARLELVQADRGGWAGASGVQYLHRAFAATGEEAFLPRNTTEQFGAFTLQQVTRGRFRAEGGVRYERSTLHARPAAGDPRFFRGTRSFDAFSASLGASYGLAGETRIGLNVARTARAPSVEELFSNGEHIGTQAYELGNPDFRTEKGWGVEATFHAHSDALSLDASVFHNWFQDFIYERQVENAPCVAAAREAIDLPCFAYGQARARTWGFEIDASARLATLGDHAINVDLVADYVRATIMDSTPAPRIPPLRLLGAVEAQGPRTTARIEVERAFPQSRTASFETRTAGYTLVNASLAFRPFANSEGTAILVSANNIFDVEARRHASVLKDFAPLSGRDIRVSLRVQL